MESGRGVRYVAEEATKHRRLATRLAHLAAAVRDVESGEILRVAGMELANQIAELLNAADAGQPPKLVPTTSPFRHYEVVPGARGETLLLRTKPVSSETIGASDSRPFVERAADLLNRVDPDQLRAPNSDRVIDPYS
jgi:hypothetical protein